MLRELSQPLGEGWIEKAQQRLAGVTHILASLRRRVEIAIRLRFRMYTGALKVLAIITPDHPLDTESLSATASAPAADGRIDLAIATLRQIWEIAAQQRRPLAKCISDNSRRSERTQNADMGTPLVLQSPPPTRTISSRFIGSITDTLANRIAHSTQKSWDRQRISLNPKYNCSLSNETQ